ncbi:MAG: NADH oxidase [Candidatus Magnetoglobus multicellularis str. Araruama]|uniref:NADH oxidase n=1 Tax=Candidatus Magnetoglobus multicellularis str. Araruama TaxID=890399 RepID=A0A1V1PC78_9BACT|nr:MAG: NADH oxidase [Candidatus Magnetoglobus multicellularis str. Araruama]
MYPFLFSPIHINSVEIKNRIAYPSLGLLYSYDRKLNDRYYHFFEARARGGAGLITVGPVGIDFIGSGIATIALDSDECILAFKHLTEIIHKHSAKAWVQLFHAGAYSHPILIDGKAPIAPSAVYSPYTKTTPREMSLADIQQLQQCYVQAALRAKAAGFDGVEILASAGYLFTQFLSPLRNKREDEYGGSLENRLRFPIAVIQQVRKALGSDYPLTIRMAGNDFVSGSNTDQETPEIAKAYERAGVDAINVTGGWHESRIPQLPMNLPRSAYAYLAFNIKQAVSVPVMASNRIADPMTADQIIKNGMADMVNLGRVLIADPYWPQKAMTGRASEIRPCVACSQGCTDQIFSGKPVGCIGNPEAGFENTRQITQAENPQKVMVIGAGVAGLEAAITASKRGHHVSLFEKESDIGGQLWLAGAPPHKQELLSYMTYYRAMLKKYSVNLHLNTCMDIRRIQKEKPDYIIIAEGAAPLVPPIKGLDAPNVLSAWDVLKNDPFLGKQTAVIGGGSVGLETALYIASKGTLTPEMLYFLFSYQAEPEDRLRQLMFKGTIDVTVFEMQPKVAKDVGKSTKWILLDQLQKYHVNIITSAKVLEIKGQKLIFEKNEKNLHQHFDHVVIASGSRSVKQLSTQVSQTSIPFQCIGDCVKPGKLSDAIHGGYLAAIQI